MSDLISLERAKTQIPGAAACDDALIAALIPAASNVIETHCGRIFAQATYNELHDGTGTPYLYINNPPIQSVAAVRSSQMPAVYVQFNDPTNQVQAATITITATGVTLTELLDTVTTTHSYTFASYPTFGDLSTAINLIGGGWLATQPNQFSKWKTTELFPFAGCTWSVRNISCPLTVYWWFQSFFRISPDVTGTKGEVYSPSGFMPGVSNYLVQYVGGYSNIPDDIQQACAELVQLTLATTKANPLMTSETLDKYSYTRAAEMSFANLSITAKKAIAFHKVYSVARYA